MFNLKNIPEEIKFEYAVGYSRFNRILQQLEPSLDGLGITYLQRSKTYVYHFGLRLQELPLFPLDLIKEELISLHIKLIDIGWCMRDHYGIPKKFRNIFNSEFTRIANLFAETKKSFFSKKYLPKEVLPEAMQKSGQELIALSYQMYQLHLQFEKNRDESSLNSNSLWQ
jgi:hypothetical protein